MAGYWVSDGSTTPAWVEFANPYTSYNDCIVSSIALYDGKVYAGGSCYTADSIPINKACYWVSDGTATPTRVELENPNGSSYSGWVNSVAVKDGVIYAGGACYNSSGVSKAGYWVSDGTATPVYTAFTNTHGSSYDSNVYSIAIDGDDIYFAGDVYSSSGAEYTGYHKNSNAAWTELATGYDTSVYWGSYPCQIVIK
ncbi:MAG: hypothetical protein EPN93_09330 [Spirochaetes bacterium]|nr:MAG: hypothetical protein EPN93_09330 [Spirochaetota bacterium]